MIKVLNKIRSKASSARKKTAAAITPKRKTKKKVSQADFFKLIEKKAFDYYAKRGQSHGDDQGDWYEAEKAVMKTYLVKK